MISFCDFASELGVTLRPGQRVLCRVAFDGVQPGSLRGAERDTATLLFGPLETVPASSREIVALVFGGRAGKSYLSALRLLHLALTVPLHTLAPGERATANIIAPDLSLAKQTLSYVQGAVMQDPRIARLVAQDSAEQLVLRREDAQREVSITCRAASSKGKTGRGRSLVGFVLDEAAIFLDADHKVNDAEVFRANAPRVMLGGQGIIASTPWAEQGLLYDLWRSDYGTAAHYLVGHAPTKVMRDEPHIHRQVDREYARDAENAEREFGARFMSIGSQRWFDESTLQRCIETGLQVSDTAELSPTPGALVTFGGDFAFVSDSSALVGVHRTDETRRVACIVEERPAPGQPLQPSVVMAAFAAVVRRHGADSVMTDSHYAQSVVETFVAGGVNRLAAPEGQGGKSETYTRVRTLMREGKVRLPQHDRLLQQLRAVSWRPVAGGGISISSPRGQAGHGDLVSALVLALWQEGGSVVPRAVDPSTDTRSAAFEARLQARVEREKHAAWWER